MENTKLFDDELLDLVDQDDRVIGQKLRSDVYAEKLHNYRMVGAMVVNHKQELWIPRRTVHKKILPGCFATSMGGHVASGETYLKAFGRELEEELYLKLSKISYKPLGLLTPHKHGICAFTMMYEIAMDDVITYNKNDFAEGYWLTPQQFFTRLKDGEKSGDILIKVIELFYC